MRLILNRMLIWSCEDHRWIIISENSEQTAQKVTAVLVVTIAPELNLGVAVFSQCSSMDVVTLQLDEREAHIFISRESRFALVSLTHFSPPPFISGYVKKGTGRFFVLCCCALLGLRMSGQAAINRTGWHNVWAR